MPLDRLALSLKHVATAGEAVLLCIVRRRSCRVSSDNVAISQIESPFSLLYFNGLREQVGSDGLATTQLLLQVAYLELHLSRKQAAIAFL